MWMQGGVAEEDRLDRERGRARSCGARPAMLRPHRRRVAVARRHGRAVDRHGPGRPVPRKLRHRPRHHRRRRRRRSTWPSSATWSSPSLAYFANRAQIVLDQPGRRGASSATCASGCSTTCSGCRCRSTTAYKAGVLVSRMTSDVDSLAELVQMGLSMFVANALLLVVSLVVLALGVVAAPARVPRGAAARDPGQRQVPARLERAPTSTCATASATRCRTCRRASPGVRVVQAFGREDVEVGRFARGNRELYDSHMRSVRISAWYLPVIELAGLGHHRAGARRRRLVGARGHADHRHGGLLRAHPVEPVRAGAAAQPAVQHGPVGRRRPAQAVRAARHAGRRGRAPGRGRPARRRATSRSTASSFAYGDGPRVLRDVDARRSRPARAWRSSGRPGAGKSTLAKLVARLYDPTEGQVTFGGVDLRDATLSSLRERIVVIPQEGFLFNGTIRDNVRLARAGATDAEVDDALRAVGVLRPVRGAARGPRHRGPRAGQPAVGRGEAARVAGPGRAGRPGGAGARRGDVAASTRAPRRWSRPRSTGCSRAGPSSSSPTASRPPSGPTWSAWSTAAGWSSSAPTPTWSRAAAPTPRLYATWVAGTVSTPSPA